MRDAFARKDIPVILTALTAMRVNMNANSEDSHWRNQESLAAKILGSCKLDVLNSQAAKVGGCPRDQTRGSSAAQQTQLAGTDLPLGELFDS